MAQLDAAGITVVAIDYYAQTLERHLLSTRILGAVMGHPEQAEALARMYEAKTRDTMERVAKAGPTACRIQVELAQRGPSEIGNSYGRGMWAGVIELVGGQNITAGQIANRGPLIPHTASRSNPM